MRKLSVAAIAALVLALFHPAPASADDPYTWYDGGIAYTDVVNCTSQIQGSPYVEKGIGAYAGYWADPDSGKPAVGETIWIHYVVYGLGNPCNGGTYFTPRFSLPQGVYFDTNKQIQCAYDDHGGPAPQAACPGWGNMAGDNTYYNDRDGGYWGVAQGHHWEFQVPVTASQTLSGADLTVYLATLDGGNNATVPLKAPMYVFNGSGQVSGPQVMYDNPSSYNAARTPAFDGQPTGVPTRHGFLSQFQAVTNRVPGTARLELGAGSQTVQRTVNVSIAGTDSSYLIWTDWDDAGYPPLQPNTTYWWRGSFFPNGGGGSVGAWQHFTTNATATGITSSEAVGTGGGTGGGLSGGGTLGTPLTPTTRPPAATPAPAKAAATVKAKVKGRLVAARRGKIAVTVTSARGAAGTIRITEKGKLVGRGTLSPAGTVVVTLNRKLKAGRHVLAVAYSGSSATNPGSVRLRVVVRR